MTGTVELLVVLLGLCVLFGVVYPLCSALVWPFYRLRGGKDSFRKWMREM